MAKVLHTRDCESELNEETETRKNEYYNKLQDAEADLYNLKQVICQLEEDEKSYLSQIEAAEQDYLSWDKKCTSAAKEKEKYELEKKPGGEIEQLKREIHRMEMRYGQLKATQKKLMNDLDACVTRRERIMDNVRARAKRNTKENTKKYLHEKKVQQLRNQVKQVQTKIKNMEKLGEEYKARKEDLINENTNKENQLKSLQENIDKIERQLQEGYLHKQKNLEILVRKQRRARHYSQLKDGKYKALFRTEASLELETIKQSDTNQNLISLLETLLGDFPSLEYSLKKVLNTLKLNELITH
uniref:Coiled-coil domain-containing protein 40 n=2 Tax=Cacopsylla melanoneura TaxID=428564 RepID=A0A8D8QLE7_9HEMI